MKRRHEGTRRQVENGPRGRLRLRAVPPPSSARRTAGAGDRETATTEKYGRGKQLKEIK